MLYHLVKYFSQHFDIPGVGMFLSLSFRAAMAIILALTIGMIFGRKIIRLLQRRQIGEEVRNLGLEGQLQKRGTDRKSTRLNSSHRCTSRMPSSA